MIWNGDATLANQLYGESYGVDWAYVTKEDLDIVVDGRLIKIGEEITAR